MNEKKQEMIFYEKRADEKDKFYLAKESLKNGKRVDAHFHKSMEMLYLLNGKITVCINAQKRELLPGQMVIVNSYDVHYYIIQSNTEYILSILGEDLIQDFLGENRGNCFPNFLMDKEKNESIARILNFWIQSTPHYSLRNKGFSLVLLSEIIGKYHMIAGKKMDDNVLIKTIIFVENNFSENITLDDLAKHIGYTKSYCSKLFNEIIGENFCNYVNRFRVKKAKAMLKMDTKNEKTILEIALDCGFRSVNSFYRAYNRMFDDLPRRSL